MGFLYLVLLTVLTFPCLNRVLGATETNDSLSEEAEIEPRSRYGGCHPYNPEVGRMCAGVRGSTVEVLEAESDWVFQETYDIEASIREIGEKLSEFSGKPSRLLRGTRRWKNRLSLPALVPARVEKSAAEVLEFSEIPAEGAGDCQDALDKGSQKPGVYLLQPEGSPYKVMALCIEGWTIIQRRYDGSEDFYRLFEDYLKGFGNFSGEFWLGLENIYQITKQRSYTLRVDVSGATGKWYYGVYPMFSLGAETTAYELHVNNMSSGNYFDGMADGNGQGFSSRDMDSDKWRSGNCARYYRGGWWTGTCDTDLNRMWCGRPGCLQWAGRKMMTSMIRIKPTESVVKEDTEENPNPGGLLP